jgi:hypothetical protein
MTALLISLRIIIFTQKKREIYNNEKHQSYFTNSICHFTVL